MLHYVKTIATSRPNQKHCKRVGRKSLNVNRLIIKYKAFVDRFKGFLSPLA